MIGKICSGSFVLSNVIYLQLLVQETIRCSFLFTGGEGKLWILPCMLQYLRILLLPPGGIVGTYMLSSSTAGQNNLSSVYTDS